MPLLFSYGTLQQDAVQTATFGRVLAGAPDELVGYAKETIRIEDADVVAKSGKADHPIVVHTGWGEDRVAGTVFEVTDDDLERIDGRRGQPAVADHAPGRVLDQRPTAELTSLQRHRACDPGAADTGRKRRTGRERTHRR